MEIDGTRIKIMNLIPITSSEIKHRADNGSFSIFDYFCEQEIDLFKDRS